MRRLLVIAFAALALDAQAVDFSKLLQAAQGSQAVNSVLGPKAAQLVTQENLQAVAQARDAVIDISENDEIELGKGIAANLLGAAPLLDDQGVQQYVNRVGRWVAAQSERPDLPWKFGVLDDGSYNAFAVPGGMVFVTKGLLMKMRNEAELAGVLGHEVAHVVQKHHLNAIKANARTTLMKNAADRYTNRSSNAELGKMLIASGTELLTRGLDKSDEYDADRVGVVFAARSGYDPFGLPAVLQTLQGVQSGDAGLALLFKTHPPLDSRLEALSASMAPLEKYDSQPNLEARFADKLGKR
jgi:predicted Zn-dependent protease